MKKIMLCVIVIMLAMSGCTYNVKETKEEVLNGFYYERIYDNEYYSVLRSETGKKHILRIKNTNTEYVGRFQYFCIINDNLVASILSKEYKYMQGFILVNLFNGSGKISNSIYSLVSDDDLNTAVWKEIDGHKVFDYEVGDFIKERKYSRQSVQMNKSINSILFGRSLDDGIYKILDCIYSSEAFDDKYGKGAYFEEKNVRLINSGNESAFFTIITKYETYKLSINDDTYTVKVAFLSGEWRIQEIKKE